MFDFHKNHKKLVVAALVGFLSLSLLIAVMPAYQMQKVEPLSIQQKLTDEEAKGLKLYISEGCVACHTQQVRNIEMDEVWGKRPSMPSDYYYSKQRLDLWRQSPSLLGSERTGPDLTNVGLRQPSSDWHLLHLFNPRIVVKESIMPSYSWLFEVKEASQVTKEDVVVPVPEQYAGRSGHKVVATRKALYLVKYLQSLKQFELPGNSQAGFIPSANAKPAKDSSDGDNESSLPDGEQLFMRTCAACHQQNGQGLAGAFPPLAGSPIVKDENPELMIKIILQGYDARSEYAQMPPFADQLTDEEIAAIATHERKSWGNQAPPVTAEKVAEIRAFVMNNM